MKSFIFGHSHVWSIRRAIASGAYKPASEDFDLQVLLCGTREFPGPIISTASNGKLSLNSCLVSELRKVEGDYNRSSTNLISMVQGNYYNILGLVQSPELFDFIVPGAERLKRLEDALNVPFDIIDENFSRQTRDLEAFLKYLGGMGYRQVVHVDAPPPIESEDFIINDLSEKGDFNLNADRLSPALLRKKLWLAQRTHIKGICDRQGVTYIGAPESAITQKGFLKREYWKDAVHANEHYSAKLLEALETTLKSGT